MAPDRRGSLKPTKARAWFHIAGGPIFCHAAVCTLMFCSGCLHHKISIVEGYRIDEKGDTPMLVPNEVENTSYGEFQTTTVTLPAGTSAARVRVPETCAIRGAVFSLQPGSHSGSSWTVRSPRTSGWDTISGHYEIDAQWKQFILELARMHEQGCFPPGLSTQLIRSAIARRIPLPADLVPMFMYSDPGEHFVNLAPDMEIRIQKVLSTGASSETGSSASLHLLTVDYAVVSRPGGGIGLKRNHNSRPRTVEVAEG